MKDEDEFRRFESDADYEAYQQQKAAEEEAERQKQERRRKRQRPEPPETAPTADPWPLDRVIYRFNGTEDFSIRDACEGVQIFGGIGSGKTSGSGAALAKAYLRAGFGGLVLCAKKDEAETWRRYAAETGRSDSIVEFDTSGKWCFPFLQYEVAREGEGAGNTENLVRLFTSVQEAMSRTRGGGGEAYWQLANEQLMRNAIDLCMLSIGEVSVPLLYDIVMSAPTHPDNLNGEEAEHVKWRNNSRFHQLCVKADEKFSSMSRWEQDDFDATTSYWTEDFARLGDKQRASILSMFTSMADCFMRRPFRMLFSELPEDEEPKILYPDLSHHGIVIILNLPVKEYGEAGRAAQMVYKYMWQQAIERRNVRENSRPCFLWVDESQNFASAYDMQFQATARSSRACTVFLTQNMPNYYAEMGGEHSKYRVDSLIGNLQTKIWHANADPETNTTAAETIGKSWQQRASESTSIGPDNQNLGQQVSWSYDYDVIPQEFTRLSKGGPLYGFEVEGIVFQNGRIWHSGLTHLYAIFNQLHT